MQRARASITSAAPTNIVDVRFDADTDIFAASTTYGFAIYRSNPLELLRTRNFGGTIAKILPLHSTNILFLVGGGSNPQYPPNKVIAWDESLGRVSAEIEFDEEVRGLATRRGTLAVALRKRVVQYDFSPEGFKRINAWETSYNKRGLVAMATNEGSTVMVIPAPHPNIGHVRIAHLKPCPPKPLPSPPPNQPRRPTVSKRSNIELASLVQAHNEALSCIAVSRSGARFATTSERGTIIRIWDSLTGVNIKEVRRGMDTAFIYGIAFSPDEDEISAWSDKGTVHLFKIGESGQNRTSVLSSLTKVVPSSLPGAKYVLSEWSYASYTLPSTSKHITLQAASAGIVTDLPDPDAAEEGRAVVGWIQVGEIPPTPVAPPLSSSPSSKSLHRRVSSSSKQAPPAPKPEYQLIALTYSGKWYRLGIPSGQSPAGSSSSSESGGRSGSSVASTKTEKGKEKMKDIDDGAKRSRTCVALESKSFGAWNEDDW